VGRLHGHTPLWWDLTIFSVITRKGSYASLYNSRETIWLYRVEEIPEQEIQHETVSSTKIRKGTEPKAIFRRANAYLDHHYFMVQTHLERKSVSDFALALYQDSF
jgi:FAD synthase